MKERDDFLVMLLLICIAIYYGWCGELTDGEVMTNTFLIAIYFKMK